MLRFTIGSHVYKVVIATQPLKDHYGRKAMGLCHGSRRLIEIAPDCPAGERLSVLLHELRHAWCYHFPCPTGEEPDADHYASMTCAVINQLMNQGGPAAVLALELDTAASFDPNAFCRTLGSMGSNRIHACSCCQQRIAPGSVLCGVPSPHPSGGAPIIALAFFCPHCEHVQTWTEFVNGGGGPSGVHALEPRFIGGEEASRFCLENLDKTNFHPAT